MNMFRKEWSDIVMVTPRPLSESDQLGDNIDLERFEGMEIDELYRMINANLDKRGTIAKFRGNVNFKVALVMCWIEAIKSAKALKGAHYKDVNAKVMEVESSFLDDLVKLGVKVDVSSELSSEQLSKKPQLLFSTHQGGGLETYLLAELLRRGGVKNFRYLMKDENVKLPLVGETIAGRGPILVSRAEIKLDREKEILKVAREIVEALVAGENVLFFFEGTRSKTGLIAHTENRRKWGRDLNNAITEIAGEYPKLDYGKVLVVLDMLSVLPEAIEKNPLASIRTNGDCSATMVDANNLSFEETEDEVNMETIFTKARRVLRSRLIERIGRVEMN